MKGLGKIAICLAGGLVLSTGARAGDDVLASNPYAPIVARNIFGLNPPTPESELNKGNEQLPKITLTGIMSIFGQLQALYKVAPKPGVKDAKEASYILGEGQAQDEVEVVRIDELRTLVTFNNHGTVQEVPLANTPKISSASSGGGGGGFMGGGGGPAARFGGPRIGGGPGGILGGRFGAPNRGGSPSTAPNQEGGQNPQNDSHIYNPGAANSGQSLNSLSAEDRAILTAAQHLNAQQQGHISSKLFPPTPFDKEAGIEQ
jgi:hypothetical protein